MPEEMLTSSPSRAERLAALNAKQAERNRTHADFDWAMIARGERPQDTIFGTPVLDMVMQARRNKMDLRVANAAADLMAKEERVSAKTEARIVALRKKSKDTEKAWKRQMRGCCARGGGALAGGLASGIALGMSVAADLVWLVCVSFPALLACGYFSLAPYKASGALVRERTKTAARQAALAERLQARIALAKTRRETCQAQAGKKTAGQEAAAALSAKIERYKAGAIIRKNRRRSVPGMCR